MALDRNGCTSTLEKVRFAEPGEPKTKVKVLLSGH